MVARGDSGGCCGTKDDNAEVLSWFVMEGMLVVVGISEGCFLGGVSVIMEELGCGICSMGLLGLGADRRDTGVEGAISVVVDCIEGRLGTRKRLPEG